MGIFSIIVPVHVEPGYKKTAVSVVNTEKLPVLMQENRGAK
jgi:hypothetical protein